MLNCRKIYFMLLKKFLSFFIKAQIIPKNIILDEKLNKNDYVVYVMQYQSIVDLIILHIQCFMNNFPDPLKPIKINNTVLSRYVFINQKNKKSNLSIYSIKHFKNISYVNSYLEINLRQNKIDIQIIPITIMIGRSPGKRKEKTYIKIIKKFFSIILYGRHSLLVLSAPISLQKIIDMYHNDKLIIYKLARIANYNFIRQKFISIGPKIINHKVLFHKLLKSEIIKKLIEDETKNKQNIEKKNKKHAIKLMKEISANYSYFFIWITDRVIQKLWNKLYIHIKGNENIRDLILTKTNVIYVPCHRSHIDYLLISYVLYHEGLVTPHIASGINLNFWPIGCVLRKLGAFFIRRTFNVNKFYSSIFREYLNELFKYGYSIEYFIEGGRSRTGYLLNPKTGILALTLQALIKNNEKKVVLIPIYIAYDTLIEANSYSKELLGARKEKESFLKMLNGFFKLKHLGKAYINFGTPLNLNELLNDLAPNWSSNINNIDTYRPNWMISTVQSIANMIMISINKSSYVNETNLLVTALLSSKNYTLNKGILIKQVQSYLDLFSIIPYSKECIIPLISAKCLFHQALNRDIFRITDNNTVILTNTKAMSMLYYRNNIRHMLIMPELIAIIIYKHAKISKIELLYQVKKIYPILKNELFLHWDKDFIPSLVEKICNEFVRQGLIKNLKNYYIYNISNCITLKLFASDIKTNIQRYAIIFSIIHKMNFINRISLRKMNNILAQRIVLLKENIHKFEFFESTMFNVLLNTLQEEGYIKFNTNQINVYKVQELWIILYNLLDNDIKNIIKM